MMLSIEEYTQYAQEAYDSLPEEIYQELNGGVIVKEEVLLHPESRPGEPLYIMGQYHNEPGGLGRFVLLFYGSFLAVYPDCTPEFAKGRIREILAHEMTHHMENLAGERDLEREDEVRMANYRRSHPK